ncbi:response regulator receiver protein [Methylorubrum populi BJ001]|jgi:DNA-binding CsgD family transcriptional regulator|uniref:Response regulator receiver protein n=1 Tax=Methylorubrum populi (strain ATCC BAA-705 / NCIMB 13946 / BJ001) TaxID=441620 RepID=B1ZJA8_METPB|nr:response regulator receiver protein [Methylorubrum populi BJ001]MBI1691938.1 DNA-binding response regulator [Methylorubrum sp. DB1722]
MTRHTARTNPTSDLEKEEIVRLREEGLSKSEIARRLGKSIGTVTHWCLTLGAEPPRPTKLSPQRYATVRGGHPVRPFAPEEDRQLLEWAAESVSYSELGRRLNRAPSSIRYRLLTLARYEAQDD